MALLKVNNELGLVTIPRCASSAIEAALPAPVSAVDPDYFMRLPTRVTCIRNPYDRMESAYKMYLVDNPWGYLMDDFNDFVLDVCEGRNEEDLHVRSQHLYASLANRIVRWNFDELADILGIDVIRRLNESTYRLTSWSHEAMEKFEETYHLDLELWRNH